MNTGFSRVVQTAPWLRVAGALAALALLLALENLGARPLNQLLLRAPGIDKVLHFLQSMAVFFGLCWLLGARARPARLLVAAGLALAAAGYDELQQRLAGGRHIELADVGAGLSGILFGAGVVAPPPRRIAGLLVAAGLIGGGAITTHSYQVTRDYNEGLRAEHERRYEDATRAYLRAIDRGVRTPDVLNAAAWALLEFGAPDPVRAVGFAEQSLAMRPGDPDTLDTYGWALHRAGRHAEALRALGEALRLKPGIYCVHYHLAMTYLALGRREDGIRHLRLQLETNPRTDEARLAARELERLGAATDGAE